jgi:UDP-N-acetylglucosamine 2-epimerase (non-hydrolysing)
MALKKKVMFAFGTRPEAIKIAPLYHALKKFPDEFEVFVCSTAQHREMLDQVLQVFDIVSDIDLDLMTPGQDLFDVQAAVLLGMRKVLFDFSPDILLVHGDTTTTLAAAIAAFYHKVPVGHIEAGLRTYDLSAPYPEELNRQIVSRIARWHFAPTDLSRANLLSEGIVDSCVFVTGNTVIDALFWVLNRIELNPLRKQSVHNFLDSSLPFNWRSDRFILITGHRRENFGDGFIEILSGIRELAYLFSDINFIYPVHLNPNVQNPVREILFGHTNIHLLPPLEYELFAYLLKYSYIVLTDSGGIQEEAPSLGKPVLVMRDVTERPEAVKMGTARLVGASRKNIIETVSELLLNDESYKKMSQAHNPYGDGKACERILDVLRNI